MSTKKPCLFPYLLIAAFSASTVAPAFASFHLTQIEQVTAGVNGDITAQAIQLRSRALGQNLLGSARMYAWDAAGQNRILLIDFTTSVANSAPGARVLVASPSFVSHTSPAAVPDFTMSNLIPASYLAAGSLTFEDDFGTVYWRLSWGGASYTGSGVGSVLNDSNGNFNPPYPNSLSTSCTKGVLFQGTFSALSSNNAADYALTSGPAVFENNAGNIFTVQSCTTNADCNDGVSCTTDVCSGGCCVFTVNNAACDDGLFCTGTESCVPSIGCVSSGNPCTGSQFCNETTNHCDACVTNANCNDGIACTVDTCVAGSCVFTPNNTLCPDNGLFCDGPEVCNAVLGCVSAGNPCTPDPCDEATHTCVVSPIAIYLETIATGLTSPVQITSPIDGTHRLFVVDQIGQIRVVDSAGALLPTPFLDVAAELPTLNAVYDERGLLGLAFHPNYANNGRFFIRYSHPRTSTGTEPCDLDTFIHGCHEEILAEYHVLGNPLTSNVANPASGTILFRVPKPQFNHNAGGIAFGPDGFLYFSLGDGGGANDGLADGNPPGSAPTHGPTGNGQNINSPLGKVLRIDVDSPPPPPLAYAIPPDNPFVGVGGLDEIYAYGLRNPFRFSFDRNLGTLYLADVGQDVFEEIDIVTKGGNYGWVIREGFHCFDPFNPTSPPVSCATTGAMGEPLIDPVSEYSHAVGGVAVVGGFVYRGLEFPELVGKYVYGDFSADFGPTGRLYYFNTTGANAYVRKQFAISDGQPFGQFLKGMGEDEDGEIYVAGTDNLGPAAATAATGTGVIYRIARPPATPLADPTGKTRFISFTIPEAQQTALRVTLTSLHHVNPPYTGGASTPFTLFEGLSMYVGPPVQYVESASSGTPLYASQLQCTPHYQNWSTIGLLHVTGEAIVPSSSYEVQSLAASCAGIESSCAAVSPAININTTRWGDVETPYTPPVTDPQPDTSDISALVNKFKSALGAPIKARALLAGSNNRGTVEIAPDLSFTHISLCVDAFKGLPYPYKPGKCTGDATKACVTDSDCTNAPNPTLGPCILCP